MNLSPRQEFPPIYYLHLHAGRSINCSSFGVFVHVLKSLLCSFMKNEGVLYHWRLLHFSYANKQVLLKIYIQFEEHIIYHNTKSPQRVMISKSWNIYEQIFPASKKLEKDPSIRGWVGRALTLASFNIALTKYLAPEDSPQPRERGGRRSKGSSSLPSPTTRL